METWQIILYSVGGGLYVLFTVLSVVKKVRAKRYYKKHKTDEKGV